MNFCPQLTCLLNESAAVGTGYLHVALWNVRECRGIRRRGYRTFLMDVNETAFTHLGCTCSMKLLGILELKSALVRPVYWTT
jgi:hypothetical protein